MSFDLEESATSQSATTPIAPIDPLPIIEHGDSPTAIILAIAILLVSLLSSVTSLMQVLMLGAVQDKRDANHRQLMSAERSSMGNAARESSRTQTWIRR